MTSIVEMLGDSGQGFPFLAEESHHGFDVSVSFSGQIRDSLCSNLASAFPGGAADLSALWMVRSE
jgi:hypothetical protein